MTLVVDADQADLDRGLDAEFDRSGHPDVDAEAGLPDLSRFESLRGGECELAFMDVVRQIRRLEARKLAMVASVERRGVYLDDGYAGVRSWLTAVTNTSKADAIRQVQTARMFERLPVVAAAAAAGDLGPEQVRLLVGLDANDRCRPHLPQSELFLLNAARELVLHDFRQVCQRWELAADPDGAHRDHELSRRNRNVTSSRIGAGHRTVTEGDALTGEVMREILDAHTEAEYQADLAERAELYGDDADGRPLARTAAQRRYDAQLAIYLKAAGSTVTTDQKPLVVIFTTPDTLRLAIEAYFDTEARLRGFDPADPGLSQRLLMCETASGAPVDPCDLARAAIYGEIRRVITDPNGHVINYGRKSRLFSGPAREAILIAGDRCNGPGCLDRHGGIQIDHLHPWSWLGRTDQDNGGPSCPRCNRAKHRRRFTVTRNHSGWHYFRPDGTEIAPRTRQ